MGPNSSSSDEERPTLKLPPSSLRRFRNDQILPLSRVRLVNSAPSQNQNMLQEDTQQLLVAIFYWRQKQASRYLHIWRHVATIQRQKRQTLSVLRPSKGPRKHRPVQKKTYGDSILRRRQHNTPISFDEDDNEDDDAADDDDSNDGNASDNNSWSSFSLSPPQKYHNHPDKKIPVLRPAKKPPVMSMPLRQLLSYRDSQHACQQHHHHHHHHQRQQQQDHKSIKTRWSLLSTVWQAWSKVMVAGRQSRHAAIATAILHWRTSCLRSIMATMQQFAAKKKLSNVARSHANRRCCKRTWGTWHYVTWVCHSGKVVAAQTKSRLATVMWHRWIARFVQAQRWRLLILFTDAQRRQRLLHRVWLALYHYASRRRVQTKKAALARTHAMTQLLTRMSLRWQVYARVSQLRQTCIVNRTFVAQRITVRQWQQWTARQHVHHHQLQVALRWRHACLGRRSLRQWRHFWQLQLHWHYCVVKTEAKWTRRFMMRVWHAWQAFCTQRRHHYAKTELATCWYVVAQRRKHFHAWVRSTQDKVQHRMANMHFYKVRTETTFYGWRR
jgi:hypothetical protein